MRWIYGLFFALILAVGAGGVWFIYGKPQEPKILTVYAGPRDGDAFTLMREISQVVLRHSDTLRLRVRPSLNSSVNIRRLRAGEAELATVESNTPAYSDIQLVADLFSDYFILIAHADKPIYRMQDLPNHRITIPEDGSSGSRSFWSVVDHYSVAPESFRSLSVSGELGKEQFMQRKSDAIFLVNSLRDPSFLSFLEEARLRGIDMRFIAIDQAQAMSLKRPFIQASKIVRGAFDGSGPLPVKDIETATLQRLLVARDDADEDAVNELVNIIFEKRLDLLIRMPLSANIAGPNVNQGASLPFHPGAARYYDRDKPSFLQENAEPLALIITILAMIGSALLALRRSLSAKAKNKADVYNVRLLEISRHARESKDMAELMALQEELSTVLETVVKALDSDQVTEEGFQSFAFLWNSVRDVVNERRQEISAQAGVLSQS
ncbi:TAXI family TRAP transporter solute-binding subunit [Pseudahrensia aquimaris]|uniref:TAXI family TRAP transporter solute-binding subunit n=1 Tax=Pseudahrensia aquimaris TaxID=744461 RepID=A0ABW3FGC2_9HYPH